MLAIPKFVVLLVTPIALAAALTAGIDSWPEPPPIDHLAAYLVSSVGIKISPQGGLGPDLPAEAITRPRFAEADAAVVGEAKTGPSSTVGHVVGATEPSLNQTWGFITLCPRSGKAAPLPVARHADGVQPYRGVGIPVRPYSDWPKEAIVKVTRDGGKGRGTRSGPVDDPDLPFRRRLRRTRLRRRWSQMALARRMYTVGEQHDGSAGVEALSRMISKWENAKNLPDQYNRHVLAEALGVTVADLGLDVDPDFFF